MDTHRLSTFKFTFSAVATGEDVDDAFSVLLERLQEDAREAVGEEVIYELVGYDAEGSLGELAEA